LSFGLSIEPSVGAGFADCKLILNPIVVRASASFNGGDDDGVEPLQDNPKSHFYVTECAAITIGPSEGRCDPAAYVYPLEQYFAERKTVSSKHQYDISLEASANPKGTLKASRGDGKSIDYDSITIALKPIFIGSAKRHQFQWRYQPFGTNDTSLEFSTKNPPVHEATYRVHSSDTPKHVIVNVQARFRKKGKLARKESTLRSILRLQNDLQVMHLIAQLEAKIGNEKGDWFLFPSDTKEGCHLGMEVKFSGTKLGVGKPVVVQSGDIVATLATGK
jgi:hypothetical protein